MPKKIIIHKKYLLVVAILLFSIFFGKNYSDSEYSKTDSERRLEETIQSLVRGRYSLNSGTENLLIPSKVDTRKGDVLKISFQIEEKSGLNPNGSNQSSFMTLFLKSQFGQQKMGTIELKPDFKNKIEELTIMADNNYSDLFLEKNDPNDFMNIQISNIHVTRLNINTLSSADQLRDSLIGEIEIKKLTDIDSENSETHKYRFDRKNQIFGQTFDPKSSPYLLYADIKMSFIGSGGSGNYALKVWEIDGKELDVNNSKAIAYYHFDQKTADGLLIGKNQYRVPITAKLSSEKRYFIGISNEAVNFNLFNTLVVMGTKGSSKDGISTRMLSSGNFSNLSRIENLSIKLYGGEQKKYHDIPIPVNAVIQDKGEGEGLFKYDLGGSQFGYLDIIETKNNKNTMPIVYYDNIQEGISALTKDDTSFTFMFNTFYPIKAIGFRISESKGDMFSKCRIYYSFDRKEWNEAKRLDYNIVSDFDFQIQGSGNNIVYLKIAYDQEDASYLKSSMFGIKELLVEGQLIIK